MSTNLALLYNNIDSSRGGGLRCLEAIQYFFKLECTKGLQKHRFFRCLQEMSEIVDSPMIW